MEVVEEPGRDALLCASDAYTRVCAVLAYTDELDPDLKPYSHFDRSHILESLSHFYQERRPWLKNPTVQRIMQQKATRLVIDQPVLLHAVIAISAAHLANLRSGCQTYRRTSLIHWQHSLRAISRCLHGNLEVQNADALFSAGHIQSMLAHIHESRNCTQAEWSAPNWLTLHRGVKVLWDTPEVFDRLRLGIWRSWTQSCEVQYQQFVHCLTSFSQEKKPSHVICVLRSLCEQLPEDEALMYRERINFLRCLECSDDSPQTTNMLSWFITRAPEIYISKLIGGDEMSLLLLLYWCRLSSDLGQWWHVQGAKQEARRIYTYLRERTHDHEVGVLLEYIVDSMEFLVLPSKSKLAWDAM